MLKVWLSCVDVKSDSILIYQRECSPKCFRRIVFKGTPIGYSLINSYVKWIFQLRQYYSINFAGVRNARVSAQNVLGRLLFTNPWNRMIGPEFTDIFSWSVSQCCHGDFFNCHFKCYFYLNTLSIFSDNIRENLWQVYFFLLQPLNHNLNVHLH